MPEMADTPVAPPAAAVNPRWRTCLHEAGHVVAGVALLKQTSRAAVFSDGGGVACLGGGSDVPQTDEEALAVAAGIAAGALSHEYQPPQVQPLPPVEDRYPELASRLKARSGTTMSDDEAIARWCIQGVEGRPHRWKRRHDRLHDQAASFVTVYTGKILEVATALFGCGVITLPAGPARKDQDHVG